MASSAKTPGVIMLNSMEGAQPIELKGEVVVGRGSTCDVILEQDRLSRQHARLSAGDGNILVEDLGSTNGTFVNDVKIDKATFANHEDIIRFDRFAYKVCVPGMPDNPDSINTEKSAKPEAEILDAKTQVFAPPKSWALDDKKSTEGTQVMSLDMLKQGSGDSDASIADSVETSGPVLVGLSGELKGKVFKFSTRDKLTKWEIGRDQACEIHLDDVSVSNSHAQLIHEGLRWKLIDLMSANGTYVNGNKGLTSYLSSGDTVRFGQVEFVFRLGEGDQTSQVDNLHDGTDRSTSSRISPMLLGIGAFVVTATVLYFLMAR
jgi:pSer/pThr/pTyr-binding forkhead associated (FHA) protein